MAIVQSRSRRAHVDDVRVKWLVRGALGWTLLAATLVLLVPAITTVTGTGGSDGPTTRSPTTGQESLLASQGWGVAGLLVVPVLLAIVAALWGQRSRTALVVPAVVYDLGVVLSILSVGIFFAPAALALTVAALARRD